MPVQVRAPLQLMNLSNIYVGREMFYRMAFARRIPWFRHISAIHAFNSQEVTKLGSLQATRRR